MTFTGGIVGPDNLYFKIHISQESIVTRSLVSGSIAAGLEGHVTAFPTVIRSLSSMNFLVDSQVSLPTEHLPTHTARQVGLKDLEQGHD